MFKIIKKYFVASAVITFLITGLAKVVSAFGNAEVLTMRDPVLHVSFTKLMFFSGALELTVATLCLFYRSSAFSTAFIAWMATTLTAYRIGMLLNNWHEPCSCLGSMTGAIHISPHLADNILKIILIYLLFAGYSILFLEILGFNSEKQRKATNNCSPRGFVGT